MIFFCKCICIKVTEQFAYPIINTILLKYKIKIEILMIFFYKWISIKVTKRIVNPIINTILLRYKRIWDNDIFSINLLV